jgi:hypothetical protein
MANPHLIPQAKYSSLAVMVMKRSLLSRMKAKAQPCIGRVALFTTSSPITLVDSHQLFSVTDKEIAMSFVLAADAIFQNITSIPKGMIRVGYTTGSSNIKWPTSEFIPTDIRICQDGGSDITADELDVEDGAATNADAVTWYPKANAAFENATRPGQRAPALYTDMNNLTPLVNALVAAHITSGPVLHLAQPGDTLISAEDLLAAAGGPFPVVAIQYKFSGSFDLNVYSPEWYANVSKAPVIDPKPVSGTQKGWAWCTKCQGLFFAPHISTSHCPGGGLHNDSGSFNYELSFGNG